MTASTRPPVVVGLDGSDSARAALDWAIGEARLRRLPLQVIHTWSVPLPPVAMGPAVSGPSEDALREVAQTLLEEADDYVRAVAPEVEVTTELRATPPASALIQAAADAHVVVVGSRGLSTFAELLVGSVSVQVATHAPCPVVVVRPIELGEAPGADAGRVVVGVDGSPLSVEATRWAFEEASLRGLGLTVLHAWDVPYFDAPGTSIDMELLVEEIENEELSLMAQTVAGLRETFPDVAVEQRLVHGSSGRQLVESSRGAELVVVGSRGRGGFASLMLGSVSHFVLHHAHAPVLIVRPGSS